MFNSIKRFALAAVILAAGLTAFGNIGIAHASGQSYAYTYSQNATTSSGGAVTTLCIPLSATAPAGDYLVAYIAGTVASGGTEETPTGWKALSGAACGGTVDSGWATTEGAGYVGTRTSSTIVGGQLAQADNSVQVHFGSALSISVTVTDITPTNAGTFSVINSIGIGGHCNCTGQNAPATTNPGSTVMALSVGYVVEGSDAISASGTGWSDSANEKSTVTGSNTNSQANAATVAANPASSTALNESNVNAHQNMMSGLAVTCA